MDLKVTNVFQRNYEALNGDIRNIINVGGTRSSKTYSLSQLIIVYCLSNPNKIVSIVRKTLPSLRATVMRDVISIMKDMDIYTDKNHNKTEHIYTFPNNTILEFFSVDDEQKIRGRRRDILWMNEANEINFEEYQQLNFRTSEKIFFDFNPSDTFHWLYDLYSRPDSIKIHSTYKDNPFLEKSLISEIEGLINVDENYYKIYALGERGTPKAAIYSHQQLINEIPEGLDFIYGVDWGYNHPTALLKVYYDENTYYVEELIYESHLTTNDLIVKFNELGVCKKSIIVADYARPEIITEFRRAGYNIHNADKNVKHGIDSVKSSKLFIKNNSHNTWKEINNYKWKTQGDRIIDEPVKLYDDACDALRYAIHYHKKNTPGKVGISFSFF